MDISIYAHIQKDSEVTIELRENTDGSYVTLEMGALEPGDLTVFIHDRAKALEIASRLEKAVQQWEDEK